MKTFTSIFLAIAFIMGVSLSTSFAADNAKAQTWTGYLCDAACGGKFAKEPAKQGMTDAMGHPKSCDMKPACVAAGYGIYSKGKFYAFDKAGNTQATALLTKTTKDKGFLVSVTGTVKGTTIDVASLTESTPKK